MRKITVLGLTTAGVVLLATAALVLAGLHDKLAPADVIVVPGNTILPGYEMAIQIGGDFWALNDGTTQALPGMKAYADLATGKVTFAAAGAPTTGASATGSSIAASTGSFTGSIAGDVMTITAVGSGVVVAGGTLSGSGVA